LDIKVMITVHH